MVDNGKYLIEKKMSATEYKAYIQKLKSDCVVSTKRNFLNSKKHVAYVYKRDATTLENNERFTEPSLELTLKYNYGYVTIRIKNSLRKWYFGERSTQDFNKTNYMDCWYKISQKTHLKLNILLNAKITGIEIGVNLRLPPEYSLYLLTLIEHDRIKVRDTYGDQTVNFRSTYLSLIFYDKLAELKSKNKISINAYNKLSKKHFFLRIEVRINKISGVTFSKENIRTVNDLITNWEECFNYLINHHKKVLQIDFITPKIASKLQKGKDALIYDFIKFNGIERITTMNVITLINSYTNRPSIHRKKIAEITQKFRGLKYPSFKRVIEQKLQEKSPYLFS